MGCQEPNGERKETAKLWYLGVILSILGSVCTNLGVNLQKYSFMREAKRSVGLKRAYARQPFWVFGLLLVIGGSGLDFVALGFLPQSLATPVGGSTMVANVASAGYKRFRRIHPVIYPALSGIFGAQSVLFAKSAIELIKTTAGGSNQFATFGTYAITFSMFTCVFLQIHWLAHGLQSFDAVFVVPVFQCFFISVSIFGGGVYFKEFSSMSSMALGMFFFGAGVTLSGVFLLSQREMNKLSPKGRFRACVKAVIFIKRTQKARKMEYQWRQPIGPVDTIKAAYSPEGPSTPPVKLSKASVMPIDGPRASLTKIEIKAND
ncbi:hypothetical protein ATCC90586_008396 [Pythium insidiosum]|nr:hypothetical protein ATCC90586_008396 [Pythium insidiosum]